MVFATKLTVHGEHGPVDVADQAVAKDHARDFPIAAVADIGQRIDTGHTRRLAARLLAKRFVGELRSAGVGLSGDGTGLAPAAAIVAETNCFSANDI